MSAAVAAFLDKNSAETEVRRLADEGGARDPRVWSALAGCASG
jgi:hypothetical protein